MIAKGNLHGDGAKLATYLVTGKEGERAELIELRGFPTGNLRDAFVAAQLGAEARTHSTRPFFHAYVRLMEGESLDREQWQHVADRIEARLGFKDQPRALAFHHLPDGATHLHMAWSRHDLEHDYAIDPGLYKLKLKEISRQLERELGLTPVRNERDPEQKTLAPDRKEFEQARRLGTDLTAIRESIRDCWERSDNGKSFAASLAEHGYILARGDRRDFVIIDPAGGDHALGKRITGSTAAETRARLGDIDKAHLPGVDAAKAMQAERALTIRDRQRERGIPEYQPAPDNAPAATLSRPIVARGTEMAREAEQSPLARAEAPERQPGPAQPGPAIEAPTAPGRDHGGRSAGDVGSRLGGGLVAAIGKLIDFIGNMIAPPAPLTLDQQQRETQAAEERAEARHDAAEKSQTLYTVNEQIRDDQQLAKRLEEQLPARPRPARAGSRRPFARPRARTMTPAPSPTRRGAASRKRRPV